MNRTEKKLTEYLFEETIYSKPLPISSDNHKASIERNRERKWNEKDQLLALLNISPKDGNLLDGETFPIWLSVEVDENKFVGGVTINWQMPENNWGHEQTNHWPYTPYLKKAKE